MNAGMNAQPQKALRKKMRRISKSIFESAFSPLVFLSASAPQRSFRLRRLQPSFPFNEPV
jgi:hypothetical protein